uniref:Uncharacterized protein LOC114327716 isoform X1 n=1 Tax=Diabrotica virgifera virgifera TaxID=50390 RepID=A0A6P7FBN7_DIAVI
MPRGRFPSSPRGGYRGSSRGSSRGLSSWNGSSRSGGYPSSRSYPPAMESRNPYEPKYSTSERYREEYKPYRAEYSTSIMVRERRSPERKRLRVEAPSSRHESYYGSSRHEAPYERRPSEHHSSLSRREEFRRPSGPPPKRGSYRGRISSRGSSSIRARPRTLVPRSYAIGRRIPHISEYARRLKIARIRRAIARRHAIEEAEAENGDEDIKAEIEAEEAQITEESKDNEERKEQSKAFIKLQCPHCHMRALTYKKYELHLGSRTHSLAMRRVAFKQKAILNQMRRAQRNTQNELEKGAADLDSVTTYCPLCKLNFKQKKAVHQLSESHVNMKKFLMPTCKVCTLAFKSPMSYEKHLCTVDHIKRKQRGGVDDTDIENFTTIDSVGDDENAEGGESVGLEKIRKIEAYYCDLCKMYLQRAEESEMAPILARHCKQRVHVQRYKVVSKKEGVKVVPKTEDQTKEEDKLWADVDKDLGDILAEAQGNKSESEDEDSRINGERYDRFKLSEKGDEDGVENKLIINDVETK